MDNLYEYYLSDGTEGNLDNISDEPDRLLFTVTLVDDDPLFIEQMRDNLMSMRINQIETFSSGEEFLAKLSENDRRLIVCDYDFGSPQKMNGLQVLTAIKKKNPGLPVIMLSSQDNMTIALTVLRSGATDYFIKGTENAFTSVLTSIVKINELQRLKKNEKDFQRTVTIGSVLVAIVIGFLAWQLLS
jgi:two-component system response regulator AtoC